MANESSEEEYYNLRMSNDSSEVYYDDDDIILMSYRVDNMNITDTEFMIFPPCTAAITVLIASLYLYLMVYSSLPKDVFKYLSMQHLTTGYLHIIFLTFYNFHLPFMFLNEVIKEVSSCLDLVVTYTTSCIAWIIFLRLYLFKDGEELYTIKGITLFSTIFLAIIQGYEMLMGMFGSDTFLISTLRLTSMLLIMCLSFSVFCITLICLISSSVNVSVPLSLFALFHLLLFMLSDAALIRFNFDSDSELGFLWASLLYVRLAVETVWYFIHDRFLYKIVF